MKQKRIILILTVITSLLFFVNCNKDDDEVTKTNQEEVSKDSRIKQIVGYSQSNEQTYKVDFIYDAENIIKIVEFEKDDSNNWFEVEKQEISYNGNNATLIFYDKESDNWVIDSKDEYIFDNNLVKETNSYYYEGGQWIKGLFCTYQYSNNLLAVEQSYKYNNNGTIIDNYKTEYIYENDKLKERKRFYNNNDNWELWYKSEFTYIGSNLDNIVEYNRCQDNCELDSRNEYLYSGDKVSQMVRLYYWDDENDNWTYRYTNSYSYNEKGYLIEDIDEDGDKYMFEYETGNGNAKYFWYFPTDYLVYNEPTFD